MPAFESKPKPWSSWSKHRKKLPTAQPGPAADLAKEITVTPKVKKPRKKKTSEEAAKEHQLWLHNKRNTFTGMATHMPQWTQNGPREAHLEPFLKLEYDRVEVSKGNLLLDTIRVFAFLVQSRNYLSSVVFAPPKQDILGGILKLYQADQDKLQHGFFNDTDREIMKIKACQHQDRVRMMALREDQGWHVHLSPPASPTRTPSYQAAHEQGQANSPSVSDYTR
ncbi:hypothetical protein K466DRAFT_601133 [Polyporus arcularius HHB13444]|uniref:Uncharacterized protein n=1 Tax=Polyporus arcularius HHB13444 TaxID=1314778 RepID=A0A5C3P982_9APHY|nr:hypothetical protein K466DRAFT_601133 [Polyporus arcularius HHB13444]